MSWKTTAEKERFFEELDRAFNTPPSQTIVVPQLHETYPKPAPVTSSPPSKRRCSESVWIERECRKQADMRHTTGVVVGPVIPKPVRRPSAVKRKSSGSSKESGELAKKSELLSQMVLFFIPNSKKNGVRKFRMTLFAQHGADVRDTWSNEVTHVICDKSINGERILRDLRWEQFPVGVVFVNELWIPECLAAGTMVDIKKDRFQVAGVQSQTSNESGQSPDVDVIVAKNGSLQVKPVNTKSLPNTESTDNGDNSIDIQDFIFGRSSAVIEREALDNETLSPSTSPQLHSHQPDALDEAINEIKTVGAAVTFLDNKDYSDNSEGEPDSVPDWQKSYQCMHAHDGTEARNNPNAKTIEILGKMQAHYERTRDEWRAISYRKVISQLKKMKEWVHTEEEARKIPGIGERLAKKIVEIATTGELQRLQNLDSSDHTIELFMGIYGVGRTKALQYVMQGFRTLQDILERGQLNESQRVGIALYDDFQQRIPRDEVTQHSEFVKSRALTIDSELQIYTMGSYRRGSATCGDIDLMITKPDATAAQLMSLMVPLVDSLYNRKFLTHTLATSHSDDGSKWHGVSKLPNGLHRRLDLLFVPWKERGAALIYFTGNDVFNRSLRLLASKKGMGLNQRGLFKDTLRGPGRVKLTRGTCIASESEEEIFRILGVPWRPPELRNC